METVILLLAAGASTRMGQSKQLLAIEGVSLIKKTALTAMQSNIGPVVAVLGANEISHRKELEGLKINLVSHPQWESGMGSSLKAGMHHAQQLFPNLENIIVLVCDQPLLTAEHLKKLKSQKEARKTNLVASRYGSVSGVPALFNKNLFGEILDLPDDQGARRIIQKHITDGTLVDFPDGEVDLDTPQDYDRFLNRKR